LHGNLRLGQELPALGITVVRLNYRMPNEFGECVLDTMAGLTFLKAMQYDLTTSLSEATVILKSFIVSLPPGESEPFCERLAVALAASQPASQPLPVPSAIGLRKAGNSLQPTSSLASEATMKAGIGTPASRTSRLATALSWQIALVSGSESR